VDSGGWGGITCLGFSLKIPFNHHEINNTNVLTSENNLRVIVTRQSKQWLVYCFGGFAEGKFLYTETIKLYCIVLFA